MLWFNFILNLNIIFLLFQLIIRHNKNIMFLSGFVCLCTKVFTLCSCGLDDETKKIHFFLQCPNYAALRPDLLTAAARIVSDQWFRYSNRQKVELFLFGSTELTNSENIEIFSYVQHFIRECNCFSFSFSSHYNQVNFKLGSVYVSVLILCCNLKFKCEPPVMS